MMVAQPVFQLPPFCLCVTGPDHHMALACGQVMV